MNSAPTDPRLVSQLAGEYVLGTLRGAARRRLERWRASSPLVEQHCGFWEERLLGLLQELRPVQPPAHVWQNIRRRLNLTTAAPRSRVVSWAVAASIVLAVALGALFLWRSQVPPSASEVATIAAPSGALMWQVEVYGRVGETGRLRVRAGRFASQPSGHDYELWALPKGGKPVSLGVLPYQDGTLGRALSAVQQQALATSAQLAVSLEPTGGSPTGQPTGAVVFVAALH
jgi:anti-sigma-K factor RskA